MKKSKNTNLSRVLNDPELEKSILEENRNSVKYIIDGPLRRVPPYYYTYLTFCKQRWIGRQLLDIFANEFRDKTTEDYKKAIDNGTVKINRSIAQCDTTLKNGDLLIHRTHKHEQSVSSKPIKIVFENDDLCVIDKPGGMPVHPTGRFNHNTVMTIMEFEMNLKVNPCNRLDRLTSGLMFMAKTSKGANDIAQQMKNREVSKEYLALVHNEFPTRLHVEEQISTVDPKVALNMIDADGKYSYTEFFRVSYDPESNMSLVLCKPKTGRTHQIRVHLQHLGYPIANDPIYANPDVWGEDLGKGCTKQNTDFVKVSDELNKIGKTKCANSIAFPKSDGEKISELNCEECGVELYTDPGPNDLDIWLHAMKYYADDDSWSYETEIPYWAADIHLPFMKLALEQAKKAPDLDGAFAVGAVLVHNNKVLETGYTRELDGNTHAEQNALQKLKLRGIDVPMNTVLYTTMEPCTYRLSGNVACADRVIDEPNIKTVFVGVMEPSTFVANNTSRAKLEDAGVCYLKIPGVAEEALAIAKKGHR